MNDFFTNLVDRHLDTSNTIQPRILGRFEMNRGRGALGSSDKDLSSIVSDGDILKSTRHESDLIESEKDYSSLSHQEQKAPLSKLSLTKKQENLSNSQAVLEKSYKIHPFDDVVRDTISPNFHAANHDLDDEMSHRMRAMLQHLPGNSESPDTEHTLDEQNSRKSPTPENKTSSLNSAVVSLDPLPLPGHQTNPPNTASADDKKGHSILYDPLEAPSWISEIENRVNSHFKDKKTNTEPVINITIGRVEVRAVQTETHKTTQQAKKPTGVTPLADYLKQRNSRRRT